MSMGTIPIRQRGAALLLFVLLLVTGIVVYFLPRSYQPSIQAGESATADALGKARAALLGYAAMHADFDPTRGPGFLPCPDTDNDGMGDAPCNTGGKITLGRLPWKQLGIGELRDRAGERLWYAVSSNYREQPKVPALHSDTRDFPFLALSGGGNELAAVVIAPGVAKAMQHRPSNRPEDYLEGLNADTRYTDPKWFQRFSDHSGSGNDRVAAISRRDLARRMEKRVLTEGRRMLKDYFAACGYLPWAAPFDPKAPVLQSVVGFKEGLFPQDSAAAGGGSITVNWGMPCGRGTTPAVTTWFVREQWGRLLYYAAAASMLEGGSGACGACLELNGKNGVPALLVAAGMDLSSRRPSTFLGDYLEGDNATAGDGRFEYRPETTRFNDKAEVVEVP